MQFGDGAVAVAQLPHDVVGVLAQGGRAVGHRGDRQQTQRLRAVFGTPSRGTQIIGRMLATNN